MKEVYLDLVSRKTGYQGISYVKEVLVSGDGQHTNWQSIK